MRVPNPRDCGDQRRRLWREGSLGEARFWVWELMVEGVGPGEKGGRAIVECLRGGAPSWDVKLKDSEAQLFI